MEEALTKIFCESVDADTNRVVVSAILGVKFGFDKIQKIL